MNPPTTQPAVPAPAIGRSVPHVPDVEQAVLGAILLERDALFKVQHMLRTEMFHETRHRHIYDGILALAEADLQIDLVTITDQLRKLGTLEILKLRAFKAQFKTSKSTAK